MSGELGVEARAFLPDGNELTRDQGIGLFGRLEAATATGPLDYKARAFSRTDGLDKGRSLFAVEELWARAAVGPVTITAGANLLNWTATEAFHPADIINAPNLDSDPERYEKLGEPMLVWQVDIGAGTFSSIVLPYRTLPIIPSRRSRINPFPPEQPVGEIRMLDSHGEFDTSRFAVQGAMQATQSIGGSDFSVHAVHHLDHRQPEVIFDPVTGLPHLLYRTVTQVGGTWQHVFEPVIAKLELGYRWFAKPERNAVIAGAAERRDHALVAAGVEYGFVHEGGAGSTFFVEGQAALLNQAPATSLTDFEHDAMVGYRLSLNDFASTDFTLYSVIDVVDPKQSLCLVRVSRRLGEDARVNLTGRVVQGGDWRSIPGDSDFIRVSLSRFF